MNFSQLELPSNLKFGSFFTAILALGAVFFFVKGANGFGTAFAGCAVGFGLVTLLKQDLLSLPNRLWMQLGFILGRIVSPIVLGILFFAIFTPVAIVTRLFNRDELRLKSSASQSHWDRTNRLSDGSSFKQQF
jgi:hypothetical protein